MSLADAGALLAVGVLTAALGSALGMAGGIFVVPVLTTFAHASFTAAVAVSLVSVVACSCASAPRFLTAGLTNLRLAVVLETATVSGALVGILFIGVLTRQVLFLVFAAVMLASAWQMFAGRRTRSASTTLTSGEWGSRLRLHASYPTAPGAEVAYQVRRVPLGLTLMFGAGLLSALLGIGSGVLKIPAMDSALRLPVKVSSATANLMIGVTAAGSAAAYLLRGDLRLDLAAPVVLGSAAGAVLGARILVRLPSRVLRPVFIVLLLALAGAMIAEAFGLAP